LTRILEIPELASLPILLYANKTDIKAISPEDIAVELELLNLIDREWYLQECNAKEREGVFEGLEWLITCIRKTLRKSEKDIKIT